MCRYGNTQRHLGGKLLTKEPNSFFSSLFLSLSPCLSFSFTIILSLDSFSLWRSMCLNSTLPHCTPRLSVWLPLFLCISLSVSLTLSLFIFLYCSSCLSPRLSLSLHSPPLPAIPSLEKVNPQALACWLCCLPSVLFTPVLVWSEPNPGRAWTRAGKHTGM